jgi:hypothetical protein
MTQEEYSMKEKDIFNLIAKKENIQFALDLSEYVIEFKKKMHKSFWIEINQAMTNKFIEPDLVGKWYVEPCPMEKILEKDAEIQIRPRSSKTTTTANLLLVFGQDIPSVNFKLWWAVYWTSIPRRNITHPALSKVHSILSEHKLNLTDDPNGIRWDYYPLDFLNAGFYTRMNNEPEVLIGEVVENIWKLFTELRPHLEEINSSTGRQSKR